jgi:protein-S-isoprenylcysteine O-methyltransferase Ste14
MPIVQLTLIMFGTATYLGLAILGLGATASFFALPPLMSRIRAEERLLHMEFRGEYEAYCART